MLAQISASLKWVSLAWFIRGDASQPWKRSLQEDCLVQNHEASRQSGQYLVRLVQVFLYGSFHTYCSLKQHLRIATNHLSRRLDKPIIFSIFDLSWTSEILIICPSEVLGLRFSCSNTLPLCHLSHPFGSSEANLGVFSLINHVLELNWLLCWTQVQGMEVKPGTPTRSIQIPPTLNEM